MSAFKPPGYEKENIIFSLRKHWIYFLGKILIYVLSVCLALVILIIWFIYGSQRGDIGVTALISVYLLIATSLIFREIIKQKFDLLILTEHAVVQIDQEGILTRRIFKIPLREIRNISASMPSFFNVLFKYGEIVIEMKDEIAVFPVIPSPIENARTIMDTYNQVSIKNKNIKKLAEQGIPKKSASLLTDFTTRPVDEIEVKGETITLAKKHPVAKEVRQEIIQVVPPSQNYPPTTPIVKRPKSWFEIFMDEILGPRK